MVFEFLAELGVHGLADTFKKPKSPILSTIGFVLWGAIAGGISLLIFPRSLIANHTLRKANVIVTPVVLGGIMTMIGRERNKRGQKLVRLDRYGYAFAFAFAMAAIRFFFTA